MITFCLYIYFTSTSHPRMRSSRHHQDCYIPFFGHPGIPSEKTFIFHAMTFILHLGGNIQPRTQRKTTSWGKLKSFPPFFSSLFNPRKSTKMPKFGDFCGFFWLKNKPNQKTGLLREIWRGRGGERVMDMWRFVRHVLVACVFLGKRGIVQERKDVKNHVD